MLRRRTKTNESGLFNLEEQAGGPLREIVLVFFCVTGRVDAFSDTTWPVSGQ